MIFKQWITTAFGLRSRRKQDKTGFADLFHDISNGFHGNLFMSLRLQVRVIDPQVFIELYSTPNLAWRKSMKYNHFFSMEVYDWWDKNTYTYIKISKKKTIQKLVLNFYN